MDERRILVERVRDTFSEPLDDENLNSNPFIKWGKWLVMGLDLDKIEERSFYLESMVAVMELGDRVRDVEVSHQGRIRSNPLELIESRELIEFRKCLGDKKFRISSEWRSPVRDVEVNGSILIALAQQVAGLSAVCRLPASHRCGAMTSKNS